MKIFQSFYILTYDLPLNSIQKLFPLERGTKQINKKIINGNNRILKYVIFSEHKHDNTEVAYCINV